MLFGQIVNAFSVSLGSVFSPLPRRSLSPRGGPFTRRDQSCAFNHAFFWKTVQQSLCSSVMSAMCGFDCSLREHDNICLKPLKPTSKEIVFVNHTRLCGVDSSTSSGGFTLTFVALWSVPYKLSGVALNVAL